jgi:hypothetical protein
MIEFIEGHLGLMTLLLAIGTFWLAIITSKATKTSKNIFELESRPFIVFNKPVFRFYVKPESKKNLKIKQLRVLLGIEFKNPGKVPTKYNITSLNITFDEHTVKDPKFKTYGGIIYPSDFGNFWFGELQYEKTLTPPVSGIIKYELEYTSTDFPKKYKKSEKMHYNLISFDPYKCDWSYIEDSTEIKI